MIYAPYNKTDKFGRCADWMGGRAGRARGASGTARDGRSEGDKQRDERRERKDREREGKGKDASASAGGIGGGVETVFNFVADAGEEESFSLVDNANVAVERTAVDAVAAAADGGSQVGGRGSRSRANERRRGWRAISGVGAERERDAPGAHSVAKGDSSGTRGRTTGSSSRCNTARPMDIRPDWEVVETDAVPGDHQAVVGRSPRRRQTDLATYGSLRWFDKSYDRVTPKSEVTSCADARTSRTRNVTASEDPVMQKLRQPRVRRQRVRHRRRLGRRHVRRALQLLLGHRHQEEGWQDLPGQAPGWQLRLSSRCPKPRKKPITDDPEDINGVPQLSAEGTTREPSAYCRTNAQRRPGCGSQAR